MCHPEVPPGTPIPDVRVEDATIPVEEGAMPALLALPSRLPAPGILIINDVFGRSPFYDHLARRLAQAGFAAVTPEYFFREGSLPEPTREAAMARAKQLDFKRWGRECPQPWTGYPHEANERSAGTIGFCMGGTQVLPSGRAADDIAASFSYYGFPADARTEVSPIAVASRCAARSGSLGRSGRGRRDGQRRNSARCA